MRMIWDLWGVVVGFVS
jgi:hypothetical protein